MSTTSPNVVSTVESPVGSIRLATRDGKIVALAFDDHWERTFAAAANRFADETWVECDSEAAHAVAAYVDGDLDAIADLEVDLGGTEFQQQVWSALRSIPVGETWSYADLARAVGNDGAMRAVGSANGANPVSVVVPCHRVIRSDGSLGGYGGGLERKAWLLRHEGARLV